MVEDKNLTFEYVQIVDRNGESYYCCLWNQDIYDMVTTCERERFIPVFTDIMEIFNHKNDDNDYISTDFINRIIYLGYYGYDGEKGKEYPVLYWKGRNKSDSEKKCGQIIHGLITGKSKITEDNKKILYEYIKGISYALVD